MLAHCPLPPLPKSNAVLDPACGTASASGSWLRWPPPACRPRPCPWRRGPCPSRGWACPSNWRPCPSRRR
eukprot:10906832-Alexandrium_andersonii.AAC.1